MTRLFRLVTVVAGLVSLVPLSEVPAAPAPAPKPELARVVTKAGRSIVGELLTSAPSIVRVWNLETGEEETIPQAEVKTLTRNLSEDSAVQTAGLADVISWKIRRELILTAQAGKVASVDGSAIYINLGSADGIEVDQELAVFRGVQEIRDPDTGEVLGRRRARIARLAVVDVEPRLSRTRLTGNLDPRVEVGDVVEPAVDRKAIAVLPLVAATGGEVKAGHDLAEELTTRLTGLNIPVVERKLLTKTLGELHLQQGPDFAPESAQKVGRQVGAHSVLLGTIVSKPKYAEAHLRLVKVDTGEVLFAVSHILRGVQVGPGVLPPAVAADNFTPLFDGVSLAGWKADREPQVWSVVDETITGTGGVSHLYSDAAFGDFELKADVKINAAGNSGIYFRAVPRPGEVHPQGYEVQLLGNDINASSRTGSIWKLADVRENVAPRDAWFRVDLQARGNEIRVRIDGREVVKLVDRQGRFRVGRFALQCNDAETVVQFRNLAVRKLR